MTRTFTLLVAFVLASAALCGCGGNRADRITVAGLTEESARARLAEYLGSALEALPAGSRLVERSGPSVSIHCIDVAFAERSPKTTGYTLTVDGLPADTSDDRLLGYMDDMFDLWSGRDWTVTADRRDDPNDFGMQHVSFTTPDNYRLAIFHRPGTDLEVAGSTPCYDENTDMRPRPLRITLGPQP